MADLIEKRSPQERLIIAKTLIESVLDDLPSAQPTQTNTPNALESLDCISRQAAIDAIQNADTQIYEGEAAVGRRNYMTKDECCEIIDSLPSAQPTIEERKWIPCSERLPEEDYCTGRGIQHSESVLVTIVHHANDDDVFVDMAYTVDGKWQLTYPFDDDPDIPKWCEIIAWMPLPEPYKGENDES